MELVLPDFERASGPTDEKLKTFLFGLKSISHDDPPLGGFAAAGTRPDLFA